MGTIEGRTTMERLKMDNANLETVKGCKDIAKVGISGKVLKNVTFEYLNNVTLVLRNCKIVGALSLINCTINKIELIDCHITFMKLINLKNNYKGEYIYIKDCTIDTVKEENCNLPQKIAGCNINLFCLKMSKQVVVSWNKIEQFNIESSNLKIESCIIQALIEEDECDLLLENNTIFHTVTNREDLRWQLMNGKVLSEPLIAYKKVKGYINDDAKYYILELELPVGAVVFSNEQYKCRTNTAKVLRVLTLQLKDVSDCFKSEQSRLNSIYDITFTYELGKTYTIDNFDLRNYEVCSNGIHCFLSANEAAEYLYN